jgi:hypothetical protein
MQKVSCNYENTMDKDSQKTTSTTSLAVIAIVAAAGLAFAITTASIPAALAVDSVLLNLKMT